MSTAAEAAVFMEMRLELHTDVSPGQLTVAASVGERVTKSGTAPYTDMPSCGLRVRVTVAEAAVICGQVGLGMLIVGAGKDETISLLPLL